MTPNIKTEQSRSNDLSSQRVLITGAGGFLGSAIARIGLNRGHSVRGLARSQYPDLVADGVEMFRGDIADFECVKTAVEGCEAVFHVAAKAGAWGPRADYENTNILGTQNIVRACQELGVSRIIYTSSPSVIHSGGDIEGGDESLPYPSQFSAEYPRTKAIGEQIALAANSENLSVVALRPHLIWGPRDQHLIPRLLDRAKRGRLRHLAPEKLVDSVYIDDAARAHWDAFDRLSPEAACAGGAYFITQGEPWPIAELIEGILDAYQVNCPRKTISPRFAWWLGALLEGIYSLLRIRREPIMTRFIAEQLATAHWFSIERAREDLGYQPRRSIQEALDKLKETVSNQSRG